MRVTSLLGSAFVVVACLASCGGATETELFGGGSASSSGTNTASSSGTSGGTSGASGTSGTSGTSGASGTSGTSGTSGSSGSSGTSGKPDGGPGCKPGSKDCDSDEYCKVTLCAAGGGTCVKRPVNTSGQLGPVCGCDGVTYWNADVAASHGMNIASSGVCGATAKKCSAGAPCEGKAKCNLDQGTKQQCNLLTPTGTCWQLPDSCPENGGGGGRTRSCLGLGGDECASYCEAVDQEATFYKANNCQ